MATVLDFIRSSCTATSYPTVCFRSLATYAAAIRRNPRQLAHAALTVGATRAHETSSYITRLSPPTNPISVKSNAFHDCIRMTRSVKELGKLGRAGSPTFAPCMGNMQTWVSAALTEQNMCLGSLKQGGVVTADVKKKVVEVIQVTSNALTLVNKIDG